MSIAIEAAELMERFQRLTTEEVQAAVEDPGERAAVADERRLFRLGHGLRKGAINCRTENRGHHEQAG